MRAGLLAAENFITEKKNPFRLNTKDQPKDKVRILEDIEEARVIRMAARRTKVATQMGTQNHANSNYRRVVELIQSEAIGAVRKGDWKLVNSKGMGLYNLAEDVGETNNLQKKNPEKFAEMKKLHDEWIKSLKKK